MKEGTEKLYKELKNAVGIELFNRMKLNYPYMLQEWNQECIDYDQMSKEEMGPCGENLSRFQTVVFGGTIKDIEEYLKEEFGL